jgi:hypothetical protein
VRDRDVRIPWLEWLFGGGTRRAPTPGKHRVTDDTKRDERILKLESTQDNIEERIGQLERRTLNERWTDAVVDAWEREHE